MSGVLNDCDALLQGASVRILNPDSAFINLTASAPGFHVTGAGAVDLATVTITADLIALDGDVVFTGQGVTLSNVKPRSVDATFAGGTGIVTATVITNGETFARSYVIPVLRDGATGGSAKVLTLTLTEQVFKIAKDGANSPASITLTASGQNLGGTPSFTVPIGTATLAAGANASQKILTFANMATDSVTVQVTQDGQTDRVTIVKVREGADGADAITGLLTNESVTLPASSAGVVSSFTGAECGMKLYKGTSDDTANWAFTYAPASSASSLAYSASASTVTVTGMAAGVDTAYVDITASKAGAASITKRFTVAKSRAGASVTGARGAGHYYVAGSSWSDVVAQAACPGGPVTNDVVTISSGTFVMEKRWTGSAWVENGVVINGKLIVPDSILASSIDTRGLSLRDEAGNIAIRMTGSQPGLQPGFEAPGTKNSDQTLGALGYVTQFIGRGVQVRGNTLIKTGANGAWNSDARSKEGFVGGAYVSAVVDFAAEIMFGLTTDPDWNFAADSIDFAIYTNPTGGIFHYQNGVEKGLIGNYVVGDSLSMQYDGTNIVMMKNGVLLKGASATGLWPASVTAPLFFDSSFVTTNTSLSSVRFGPMSSNAAGVQAVADAAAAKAVADAAQTDATASKTALSRISADNWLAAQEKPVVILEWKRIADERSGIDARAQGLGIVTERNNYQVAYDSLSNYLPVGWNNLTTDTPIVRTTFDQKFADYYAARQALLNAGTAKLQANAAAAQETANSAANGLADKLSKSSASILAAPITITTSGGLVVGSLTFNPTNGLWTGGKGIAVTPYGIIGHNGTKYTFAVAAIDGSALFGGELTAAYGSFGAVYIAAGGSLSIGSTGYGAGTGLWLGFHNGIPKFRAGDANQYIDWDGSKLTIKNAVDQKPDFGVSIGGNIEGGGSGKAITIGVRTASIAGAFNLKSIQWVVSEQDGGAGISVTSASSQTQTATFRSNTGQTPAEGSARVTCTIFGIDGRTATDSVMAYSTHM